MAVALPAVIAATSSTGCRFKPLALAIDTRKHWSKLRSTNPLERLNREIGRRSDVVGIYPNDAALLPLAGMVLLEQHEEWSVGRRYLSEISMRLVLTRPPVTGTPTIELAA